MKKKIHIDHLQVGMFIESDLRDDDSDASRKKVLLLGKGVQVSSENQIRRLKDAGLMQVIIDTDKGIDVPAGTPAAPTLTLPKFHHQPARLKALPAGRKTPYKQEIKQARIIQAAVAKALSNSLETISRGERPNREKLILSGRLLAESVFRNVDAMVALTRIKKHDPYTTQHCINVCVLILAMAHADGTDENTAEILATAGLLHDIGKTSLPMEILTKPGKYEPQEMETMRKHTLYGEEILKRMANMPDETTLIALQHHERLDGSGYPYGISGDSIHRLSQIAAVADVYDGLTSPRPYKASVSPHTALSIIFKGRGIQFREDAVDLFVKSLGLYPVGSLVSLNTGEVGIVCEPNPEDLRHPKVGVFITRYKKRRTVPVVIDLSDPGASEQREIVKVLDAAKYNLNIDRLLKMTTG